MVALSFRLLESLNLQFEICFLAKPVQTRHPGLLMELAYRYLNIVFELCGFTG